MAGMVQSQKTDIDVRGAYDNIYDACISVAVSLGNIIQQNKNMGFISFKTKRIWAPPCNPVSLRMVL